MCESLDLCDLSMLTGAQTTDNSSSLNGVNDPVTQENHTKMTENQ